MLAVLLALGCALCYGGSDYTAGLAGRRSSVLMACLIAEVTRALLVVAIVPFVSVLAWMVSQEELTRAQLAGLGLAAASVGLITIGGGR